VNPWDEIAPPPHPHGDTPAAVVIDGLIYVAGGMGADMQGNEGRRLG
jgi:hypothetical protein